MPEAGDGERLRIAVVALHPDTAIASPVDEPPLRDIRRRAAGIARRDVELPGRLYLEIPCYAVGPVIAVLVPDLQFDPLETGFAERNLV